jgi:2-polyprenyl-3-methyl-5-hydroxy-6-metoxy-1,4-benzoquinol methylase
VSDVRRELLDRYAETQGRAASGGHYADVEAPWAHYAAHYTRHLHPLPREARILELGCGPGTLLAWLRALGFHDLTGVDASPADAAIANQRLEAEVVTVADAGEYLEAHEGAFDAIVLKALLEHVPKGRLLALTRALAAALRPGGLVLVEVPNMDWLLAGHERYMDLTHEVGFTRESLATLLRLVFDEVEVEGSRPPVPTGSQRLLRRPAIALFRRLLYVLGEGASETLFASRSLIAVARLPVVVR